jgi:hypothetical protein
MEAIEECTVRMMPIPGTDVSSVVSWYTATVDNNSENHESNTGGDFHHAENEFDLLPLAAKTDMSAGITNLAITLDAKELNSSKGEKQWDDPGAIIDLLCALPVMDDLSNVSFDYTRPG